MDLTEATNQFLTDLAITKSAKTVETYGTAMHHLCACCGEREVSQVSADIVPEFVTWLAQNNPVSKSSLNSYLAGLSCFYRWLIQGELIEYERPELAGQDILRFEGWLRHYRTKKRRRVPKVPDEEAVKALLEYMRTERPTPAYPDKESGRNIMLRYLRDLAIVETLRSTGMRIGEAVNLTCEDINLETGEGLVIGKGDKQRPVFWDETGLQAIAEYLAFEPASGPLFRRHDWQRSSRGRGLSTNAARNILAEWCRRAHVKVIEPHSFRHRFGAKIIRATGDLALTQDLMGHESPETTRIYTQFMNGELREAHAGVSL